MPYEWAQRPIKVIKTPANIITVQREFKYDRSETPVSYIKEKITNEFAQFLMDNHCIEWDSQCNEGYQWGIVRAKIRVVKPNT